MNLLFVTVGTSAVNNEDLWYSNPDLMQRVSGDVRHFVAGFDSAAQLPSELIHAIVDAHRVFWSQEGDSHRIDPRNRLRTSAESISTYIAIRSGILSLSGVTDRVVFLVSNTVLGGACGEINVSLFKEYLIDGPVLPANILIEPVHILSPHALDAAEDHEPPLLPQIESIIHRHAGGASKIFFNITGSYKGVIPPITYVAGRDYPDRSTILYLHESMRSTVKLTFDPARNQMKESVVPLRRGPFVRELA